MSYSQAWLEDPSAVRGLLVEVQVYDVVAAVNKIFYLSTMGYVTTTADVTYNPIINNSIQISESLDISGNSSGLSYGDLEVNNPSGELDSWLDHTKYIWVNKSINIYYGDPRWVCADIASIRTTFKLIFSGVVADIDSRSRTLINIKLRDKLERLNTPITENVLGVQAGKVQGQLENEESIKPLVFGEVFNMQPLLMDPTNFKFMFNDGLAEGIIEVRDNGVPLSAYTTNLTEGTFILTYPVAGTCTASVQGVRNTINLATGALVNNSYVNNIATIIALIVTEYGKVATRFTADDLDLSNLSDFSIANTQKVGIVISDRENVLNVCQRLASSIGAQLYVNRLGKLQLLKIGVPTLDDTVYITDNDILHASLSINNKLEVVAATSINYCINWSPQPGLITGIPEQHKLNFSKEWLDPKIKDDATTKSRYSLDSLPVPKDTLLIRDVDALAEATRLTEYYKVPRIVYKFTGTSKLLSLKLGQAVVLTHSRFNLSQGKTGQVIKLSPNWLNGNVEVEVLV